MRVFHFLPGCHIWCSENFWGSRRFIQTQPLPPGGGGGIGPGWFCGAGCGGSHPKSLCHGCAWRLRRVHYEAQDSLPPSSCRKGENKVRVAFVMSLDVKHSELIAESAASYTFLEKKQRMLLFLVSGRTCSSSVVPCVFQWLGYCLRCCSPQTAHTVSSHMALFDKGHKHF